MLAERYPEIRKAVDSLYELSADPEMRAQYEMRQKAWMDYTVQFNGAFEDGMEKKGMEIARNALAKGYSLEQVHDITGLPLETIANLKAGV